MSGYYSNNNLSNEEMTFVMELIEQMNDHQISHLQLHATEVGREQQRQWVRAGNHIPTLTVKEAVELAVPSKGTEYAHYIVRIWIRWRTGTSAKYADGLINLQIKRWQEQRTAIYQANRAEESRSIWNPAQLRLPIAWPYAPKPDTNL